MLLARDGSIKRNAYVNAEYLLRLEESLVAHRYFVILKEQCSTHDSVPFLHCLLESIRYRLPIMGSRTAIFHRLLSSAYKTPQETQGLSFPRKKLMNKTVKQWVVRANYPKLSGKRPPLQAVLMLVPSRSLASPKRWSILSFLHAAILALPTFS